VNLQHASIVHCPICKGGVRPLGVVESYALPLLQASATIEFGTCADCGFTTQMNPVSGDSLLAYYANSPRFRAEDVSASEARLYADQAQFMAAAGPLADKRVLDIGADMGKLLDHLKSAHGCTTNYQEQNLQARAYLRSHGRHTEVDNLDGREFDWIVLSQVLEHIVDPVSYLRSLRAHLGGDGMLFIEVPNHSFWDSSDYGFSFEHVNYFSVGSLASALERAGYVATRLAVGTDARYFTGKWRIVRVIAMARDVSALRDWEQTIRVHHARHTTARFGAVAKLARASMRGERPGLALYGAAELADQLITRCCEVAGQVTAVFDSDARKHGRVLHGLAIQPPENIPAINPAAILVLSSAEEDIRRSIEATGYRGRIVMWSAVEPLDDSPAT